MAESNHQPKFAGGMPEPIRNAVEKARECALVDPAVCLMCCVAAAELILRDLCVRHRLPVEADELDADGVRLRRLTAAELIQSLRSKRRIPKRMQAAFHEVRRAGNAAKHDWHGDAKTAAKALRHLEEICELYVPAWTQNVDRASTDAEKKPKSKRSPKAGDASGRSAAKSTGATFPTASGVAAAPDGGMAQQQVAKAIQPVSASKPAANPAAVIENVDLPEQVVKPKAATIRINLSVAAVGYLVPAVLALVVGSVAVTPDAPASILGATVLALILGGVGLAAKGGSGWEGTASPICLYLGFVFALAAVYGLGSAIYGTLSAHWALVILIVIAWTLVYGAACLAYAHLTSRRGAA